MSADSTLADGSYDAIVFDADVATDDPDATVIELTVIAGDHKGTVVSLRTTALDRDALDLLGIPATITVVDGAPSVSFEP